MGELVKKVKIDAGDYQRGTDETGKRLKFISATQTCQRCAAPECRARALPAPHASRRLAPALTKALSRSPPPSLPHLRPLAHPSPRPHPPPLAPQHEDTRAGPVRV